MKKIIKIVILMFFISSNIIYSQTYYIDAQNGNDNNNGLTQETAWKTINKIQNKKIQYGDVFKFKAPYSYNGIIYKNDINDDLNDVLFESYGDGKAIINPTNNNAFTFISFGNKAIRISIRNLFVKGNYDAINQTGAQVWNNGIAIYKNDSMTTISDSINYFEVSNCEITGWGVSGISVNPWTPYGYKKDVRRNFIIKIDSNKIHEIGSYAINVAGIWTPSQIIGNEIYNVYGKNADSFTLPIFITFCKNFKISWNLVYNAGHYAYQGSALIATAASRHIVISHNTVYGAKTNVGSSMAADGDGIDFDGGSDSCIAEFNYMHNNDGAGLLISGDGYLATSDTLVSKYYVGEGNYLKDPNNGANADYNIVRYNLFKNNCRNIEYGEITFYSERVGSGNYMRNTQIYNNTFVGDNKGSHQPTSMIKFIGPGGFIDTKIYNNIFLGNSRYYMEVVPNAKYNYNVTHENNIFWDISGVFNSSILGVKWNGGNYTLDQLLGGTNKVLFADPKLKNPWVKTDTIFMVDTLTNYTLLETSPLIDKNIGLYTKQKPIVLMSDTVVARLTNFVIDETKIKFDIECKVISDAPFVMGSSTFAINLISGLSNPQLIYANPKYTVGNNSGYYRMMTQQFENKITVQVIFLTSSGVSGNVISNEFEKIATISLDKNNSASLSWDTYYSTMINPQLKKAKFILEGLYFDFSFIPEN